MFSDSFEIVKKIGIDWESEVWYNKRTTFHRVSGVEYDKNRTHIGCEF